LRDLNEWLDITGGVRQLARVTGPNIGNKPTVQNWKLPMKTICFDERRVATLFVTVLALFLGVQSRVTLNCHGATIDEYTWTFLPPPGPGEGTGIDPAIRSFMPITPPAPDFTASGTLFINSSNPDVAAPGSVFSWDGGGLASASFQGFTDGLPSESFLAFTVHPGDHPTVGAGYNDGYFYKLPGFQNSFFKTPYAQILPADLVFSNVPADAQVVWWSSGGESSQFFRILYGEWDLVSSTTVAAPEGSSTGLLLVCALAVLGTATRVAKCTGLIG
jgi:hypothetical protein